MASLYNKGLLFWFNLFKDINTVKEQKLTHTIDSSAINNCDEHNMELINAFTEMAMRKINKELQLCQTMLI